MDCTTVDNVDILTVFLLLSYILFYGEDNMWLPSHDINCEFNSMLIPYSYYS